MILESTCFLRKSVDKRASNRKLFYLVGKIFSLVGKIFMLHWKTMPCLGSQEHSQDHLILVFYCLGVFL